MDKALSSLDFAPDEKTDMWRLIAAILHSGEVRYRIARGGSSGRKKQEISKTLLHGRRKNKSAQAPHKCVLLVGFLPSHGVDYFRILPYFWDFWELWEFWCSQSSWDSTSRFPEIPQVKTRLWEGRRLHSSQRSLV